jgi:hypothetical protein
LQFKRSRTDRPQRDAAAANGDKGRGPGLAGPFGDIGPAQTLENPALLGGD